MVTFKQMAVATIAATTIGTLASSQPFELTYGGRLTTANGIPRQGSLDIVFKFYAAATGGSPILTKQVDDVVLDNGVFSVVLPLSSAELQMVADGAADTWVETNAGGVAYPRQRYTAVPYALKVPVDSTYFEYDSGTGQLTLDPGFVGSLGAPVGNFHSAGIADDATNTTLTITNTDTVGLGTTSPAAKLEILTSAPTTSLTVGNSAAASQTAPVIAGFSSDADNSYGLLNLTAGATHSGSGWTGGSSRFFVGGGGYVGIGTGAPATLLDMTTSTLDSAKLRIAGDGSALATSAAEIQLYDKSADHNFNLRYVDVGVGGGNKLMISKGTAGANTNDFLTIQGSDGKVGIGTTTPDSMLHVSGTNDVTGGLTIESTLGADADRLAIFATGNYTSVVRKLGNGAPGNWLDFQNSAGGSELMLSNTGYVGIASANPNARLSVAAPAAFNGLLTNVTLESTSATTGIQFLDGTDSNRASAIQGAGGRLDFWSKDEVGAWAGSHRRMSLSAAGNLGIGTTTPTAILDVGGSKTIPAWGLAGSILATRASTTTDASTAASGTVASAAAIGLAAPTFGASNTSVTYSDAANLYVAGSPTAGTNMTISRPWSLWVDSGHTRFDGNVGIGVTNAPAFALTVIGDGIFQANTTGAAFTVRQDGTGDSLRVSDGGTTVFAVADGGNVGIKTSSPQTSLDVNGTIRLMKSVNAPHACDAARDGTLALASTNYLCVCISGTGWRRASDGSTACSTW